MCGRKGFKSYNSKVAPTSHLSKLTPAQPAAYIPPGSPHHWRGDRGGFPKLCPVGALFLDETFWPSDHHHPRNGYLNDFWLLFMLKIRWTLANPNCSSTRAAPNHLSATNVPPDLNYISVGIYKLLSLLETTYFIVTVYTH